MTLTMIAIIAAAVFSASFISAVVGVGGGILLIAVTGSILPVSVVIPLNSTFMYASLLARVVQFHKKINWKITWPFSLGSLIGAGAGAFIYVGLPDSIIAIALSCVILLVTWMPPIKTGFVIPNVFFALGVVHTFLSTLLGVSGIYQAVIARMKLEREVYIATAASGLLAMASLKIISFALAGFNYFYYNELIAAAVIAGFIGTWLGKKAVGLVSESLFKVMLKWMITLFALRMLFMGIMGLV